MVYPTNKYWKLSIVHKKINVLTDISRKKYPYICFVMTMYQALLMALVSLPFYVLESWGLKCKPDCSLSTQISQLTEVHFFKVLNDDFLVSETQQIILSC